MKKMTYSLFAMAMVMFTFSSLRAQTTGRPVAPASIQVIQFHSEHRCVTCLKIEKLARATLASYFPSVPFVLVNVEDKNNEKLAEQFEATGTALFLYHPVTGRKKDLTEFAFMRAGSEKQFDEELRKLITDFIKN